MRIHNLYEDENGESHFRDIEVEWDMERPHSKYSKRLPATGIIFRETRADYDLDWHPAPRRQVVIVLSGELENGFRDGQVFRLGPGDTRIIEDVTGEGHTTRVVGDMPCLLAVIPLDG